MTYNTISIALSTMKQGVSSLNTPGFVNMTLKQPFGVCAAILPWNVPGVMFAFKVSQFYWL